MSNKKGYFLGIYHGHNATVAVLNQDGVITDCISEERFRSAKNYTGFPNQTLEYLQSKYSNNHLMGVGLPFMYMNSVFLSEDPTSFKSQTITNKVLSYTRTALMNTNRNVHNYVHRFYRTHLGKRTLEKQIDFTAEYLNIEPSLIRGYNHQMCHAYSAYYLSPHNGEDALVLTLDGEGEGLCATVSSVHKGEFSVIAKTPLGHSLGWIYMDLTEYMGMKPNEHEYKIMGLAPYTKPEYAQVVYDIIKDWIWVEGLTFKSKFDTHLSSKRMRKELEGFRFDNLAGAFQKLVEDLMTEWVSNCINETNIHTICCAGGVFMNVKANMKISQLPEVEKMWVMPSAGDESTPLGAAIAAYKSYCGQKDIPFHVEPIRDLYLGPEYSNEYIENFIESNNLKERYSVEKKENIEEEIAKLLVEGNVVAHFSGRMEFGARALGNRSILADPSNPDIIREINEYVKNRDFWMPFAGSILEERADDYIVNPKHVAGDYMIMTYESTPLAIKEVRAAMHAYDFTIRPQIVRKAWNPRYHKIIKEFEKLTGIGGVLNTSFNLHGLPIVLGPEEALFVFENSGMKHLALENYLISKQRK